MMLRVRATSFLAGFGVAAAAALYQLRKDIITSSDFLTAQSKELRESLEQRVSALEAAVYKSQPQPQAVQQPVPAAKVEALSAAPPEAD